MRYSKILSNFLLLFLIPSLIIYPEVEIPLAIVQPHTYSVETKPSPQFNGYTITYDDILDLLDEIEDDGLEQRCSLEEFEKIGEFIAFLARQGMLPDDAVENAILENDIQELLQKNSQSFSFDTERDYSFVPAIYYGIGVRPILCKTWVKKKCKQIKKFSKKHKKALIIGAAIVVAVVVVVCVVPALAGAAGAAGGAAAAASDEDKPKEKQEEKQEYTASEPAPPAPTDIPAATVVAPEEAPLLTSVIDDHIDAFKETIVESNLLPEPSITEASLAETARYIGSSLAHQTLDGVSELASFVPQLMDEIGEIGNFIQPENTLSNDDLSASEFYEELVADAHEKIDQAFSTDQAYRYTPETKELRNKKFAAGYIPILPVEEAVVAAERIAVTEASAARGWKVGKPINNRTIFGGVPKCTVRSRHWKNRAEWAKLNPHEYGDNIPRMERGLAPRRYNEQKGAWEHMELHHTPPQREGGLFDFIEVWPEEHADLDKFRNLGK